MLPLLQQLQQQQQQRYCSIIYYDFVFAAEPW